MWEHFVEIYKQLSISKAARNLFISQQGLSKSIQTLESMTNLPLFRRDKSGVAPTECADKLYPYVKRILSDYRAMNNVINELKKNKTGLLNTGYSYGVLSALPIVSLIMSFRVDYPGISVKAYDLTDDLCENMLADEKLDIAFLVGPIKDNRIKFKLVLSESYAAWISAEHPLASRNEVSLADLKDEPIIFADERFNANMVLIELFRKMNAAPNIVMSPIEPTTYQYLAQQKLGVAIHPLHWENYLNPNEEVVSVPISDLDWKWDVYYATKTGRTPSPAEILFEKHILQSFFSKE
jgi:DNA-binding transcriptional LysR family regulator